MKSQICAVLALLSIASPTFANESQNLVELRRVIESAPAGGPRVIAVCGSSHGRSFFKDEMTVGWQDNSIKDGRLIFVRLVDDKPDILLKDVSGEFKSSTTDGGVVVSLYESESGNEFIWLVSYPRTGVTETYNLSRTEGGNFFAMWTSSKPSIDFATVPPVTLGPKVTAFVSNCI